MEKAKYIGKNPELQLALRSTVNEFFAREGIRKTGDHRIYLKTIIFMVLEISIMSLIYSGVDFWMLCILGVSLGINHALIGFNIMHDLSHGSWSKNKTVNKITIRVLEVQLGVSQLMWYFKHKICHHTYPNTVHDDDIDVYPFMRFHPEQKKLWFHRYQNLYAPLLYCILYFVWIFFKDWKKYKEKKVGPINIQMSANDHFVFWICKAIHITLFAIPFFIYPIENALIFYILFSCTCGLIISIVFQLAHIVEESTFLTINKEGNILHSYEEAQIITTSDFAVNNKILSWFLGGLNFQVIHHLVPDISHVYYFDLHPKFKAMFRTLNITYNYSTLFEAIRSHFRMLKKMGIAPST